VLPFKTRRPTRRHYFLRINFRPFSFFTRTTRAKINPGPGNTKSGKVGRIVETVYFEPGVSEGVMDAESGDDDKDGLTSE